MHRFFVNPESLRGEFAEIKNPRQIHQILRVLRMKEGDSILLLDNSGFEYEVLLRHISKKNISGNIREKRKNQNESARRLTLYQALPKKMSLFELILQKGTELGVSEFIPMITERGERSGLPKKDRLAFIIQEAGEQSGRGKLPILQNPISFEKAVSQRKGGLALLAHPGRNSPFPLTEIQKTNEIYLYIGPEGGFTENEIEFAEKNGVKIFSFGKVTLRTETAAVVSSALILLI